MAFEMTCTGAYRYPFLTTFHHILFHNSINIISCYFFEYVRQYNGDLLFI